MPHPVTARYRARDGTEHLVTVARTPQGGWHVLDVAGGTTFVIETLSGEDRHAQAHALARDYAAEQQAFQLGLRATDPLPTAKEPATGEERRWAA